MYSTLQNYAGPPPWLLRKDCCAWKYKNYNWLPRVQISFPNLASKHKFIFSITMPFQNVQNLFSWLKTKKVIPKQSLELETEQNLPLPRDIQRTGTSTWTSPTGLSWSPPCCPYTPSPAAQKVCVWKGGGSYLKFGKIHSFSHIWFESNSS
jgi:hypothetical protein